MPCVAAGEFVTHLACVTVALFSNVVRHTPSRNAPVLDGDAPRDTYLTVHTIAVELAAALLAAISCALRYPRLDAAAHAVDAFVVTLGAVLWLACGCRAAGRV